MKQVKRGFDGCGLIRSKKLPLARIAIESPFLGTARRYFISSGFSRKSYLVSAHGLNNEVHVIGKHLHPC